MIEEIRIRGVGVIDDAVLEPHPGFTAVTGETGAGKTMVLTGLGLLLGGRADAGVVRGERAEVEGRVRVAAPRVLDRVAEAGGALDDNALVLVRTVAAEGRSRAFLGGRSVPAAVLAELAEDLVAVHGQSDQQRLLAPARQRAALDRYAGAAVTEPLADYRVALERLREVEATLERITGEVRARALEADALRAALAAVADTAPQPGEDRALAGEAARLAHAETLRAAAVEAHAALAGDDASGLEVDALDRLGRARRVLGEQRDHDRELGELADRLADAAALVADVASDLASYADTVEGDPARLAAVEERRAALAALQRRYGPSLDEVLAFAEQSRARLAELDADDETVTALAAESAELRTRLGSLAERVSRARAEAATRFAAAVTAELVELAMPHAEVSVSLRRHPDADGLLVAGERVAFGPSGVDEVEILLVPHAGAPARPIAKGASGGELSRVMLAVEVVFAATEPVPTLVFDEVDAGVGGRAAVEVGRRLARLARTCQVLVVTHLPQVAAFADRQVVVRKAQDGSVTSSDLAVVEGDGRVRELARMLAGQEDSTHAAAHAAELLELAAVDRADRAAGSSAATAAPPTPPAPPARPRPRKAPR